MAAAAAADKAVDKASHTSVQAIYARTMCMVQQAMHAMRVLICVKQLVVMGVA